MHGFPEFCVHGTDLGYQILVLPRLLQQVLHLENKQNYTQRSAQPTLHLQRRHLPAAEPPPASTQPWRPYSWRSYWWSRPSCHLLEVSKLEVCMCDPEHCWDKHEQQIIHNEGGRGVIALVTADWATLGHMTLWIGQGGGCQVGPSWLGGDEGWPGVRRTSHTTRSNIR